MLKRFLSYYKQHRKIFVLDMLASLAVALLGNMVLGEVLNHPGKWSSYPPHHHPQPEVYFYRFDYPDGFGAGFANGEIYKTRHNGMS